MIECKHNFDSPAFSGQFVEALRVSLTEHPTIRNPANWVTSNIINKYQASLEFVDCYEGLITIITRDEAQLHVIVASAKRWIQELYPKPVSKYLVEGSGLLNINQLEEIIKHYAKVIHLAPRTRLDREKGAPVHFANSAVVTIEDSTELPSKIPYKSLNIQCHLKLSKLGDTRKPQPRQVTPERRPALPMGGWNTPLRNGRSAPTSSATPLTATNLPTNLRQVPRAILNTVTAPKGLEGPKTSQQESGNGGRCDPSKNQVDPLVSTIADFVIPQDAGKKKGDKKKAK